MAHDVSRELRGYHGRWAKSAEGLRRIARETEAAGKAEPGELHVGDKVKHGKTGKPGVITEAERNGRIHVRWEGSTGPTSSTLIKNVKLVEKANGHPHVPPVHEPSPPREPPIPGGLYPPIPGHSRLMSELFALHSGDKLAYENGFGDYVRVEKLDNGQYEITLKGEHRRYNTNAEAAYVMKVGRHQPSGEAEPPLTHWIPGNEGITGTPEQTHRALQANGIRASDGRQMLIDAWKHGHSETHQGVYVVYDKPTNKYSIVVAPPARVSGTNEEAFRRGIKGRTVIHPKDLKITAGASLGTEKNQKMRQEILHASTLQGQVTPDLVSRTEFTVTRAPHGKRKGATLASSTGSGNTIHVKPEVLIGSNADMVLKSNRGGWWVPTDEQHNLATNVLIHEYGHGLHGKLTRNGIFQTSKMNPETTIPAEQQFWREFAGAIGATEPQVHTDAYGRNSMNVQSWLSRNKSKVMDKVSRYAGTNQNEMFAELWTEYMLSSNPRPPAKLFGDFVTKRLGSVA